MSGRSRSARLRTKASAVNACVAAIQSSACDAGSPLFETDPACDWLTQIPVVEAASEIPEAAAEAGESGND